MKRKLLFLLCSFLLLGGSNSAWGADAYFGSSTKECGAWDATSKSKNYILQKGGKITLNFTFSTNTDTEKYPTWEKWYTWIIDVSCNVWQFACRGDNAGGSTWQADGITPVVTYSENFADCYTRDNMDGANVVLELTRSDENEVTVLATTTKGANTWWKQEVLTLTSGAGDNDMTFYLTCDNGYGEIHSVIGDNCVGTLENVTSWWNNFSDYYTINANKTLTLNFKNYSSKNDNWSNFVTVITNDYDRGVTGYAEQVVLRVDDYGWGTYYNHSNFSNNYNWTSFKNDMDGANVELKIRRLDTKVAVKATYTTTSGQKYYQQYVYTSPSGTDPIRVFLTADNSHITNLSSSTANTPAGSNEYIYTIKAVDGSNQDLKTFATGAYWTDESAITLAIPQYILSGTNLLGVAKQSDDYWYRVSVTPNAADYVHKVTYNNESISNVVYFSEAEDISGFSESTSSSITARASGGKCARSSGNFKTMTTLNAGKYKVYVRGNADSDSRKVSVKAGDEAIIDNWAIGNGTDQKTNADFSVTSNTTMTVACSATSTTGLDWVYIQKIEDVATLDNYGYATFASPYALDLTKMSASAGEVKAYKASVSDATVTFSAFEQAVPKNTGMLLKGDANATINIPVVASGSDVEGNDFLVNVDGISKEGGYYYFAMKKNQETLTFGTFDPSSITMPSNKAYLKVLESNLNGARLVISFEDDDPTAINAIEVASEETDALKDGKYFEDGKIVIVKNGVKYSANGQKLN